MKPELYYKTYSEAIAVALNDMEKQGFIVNPDESFTQIGVLSQRPKNGATTSVRLPLYKKGDAEYTKPVKWLQIQVYNRGNDSAKPFELNFYKS